MANGQQKAQQNLDHFLVWASTQTHEDFKQIIFRGQLNRREISKAAGIGKSALIQNPLLKEALANLECNLREEGVLPPLVDSAIDKPDKPKEYDNSINRKILDSRRVSSLEAENIELKAKVKELEVKLERYGELSETLYEMGFMPR